MTINTFDPQNLDPMRRKVFMEMYRFEIGRRIFDFAGRALDARTAVAFVNHTNDNDVVMVAHPNSLEVNALRELLEDKPELSVYDPKGAFADV